MNPFRVGKALYSLARLVVDPDRLGEVFEMASALSTPAVLDPIITALTRDPAVDRAFEEGHRIRFSLAELQKLPLGTLGREFADHMIAANLDPAALPNLPSPDRRSYFRAHLYETHDIWHVVTGFRTDYVGELGLQGFYLAQIPSGLPALLLATGFLRVGLIDRANIAPVSDALHHGYALGKSAKPLFGVKWDDLWSVPLVDVQRRLGLPSRAVTDVKTAA